jgi:hypothetical protein
VLRVRLPNLEQGTQVWIGVKAKYFDDLYSNVVTYNGNTLQKSKGSPLTYFQLRRPSHHKDT